MDQSKCLFICFVLFLPKTTSDSFLYLLSFTLLKSCPEKHCLRKSQDLNQILSALRCSVSRTPNLSQLVTDSVPRSRLLRCNPGGGSFTVQLAMRTPVGAMCHWPLCSSRAVTKSVLCGDLAQEKGGRVGTDLNNISGIDRYGGNCSYKDYGYGWLVDAIDDLMKEDIRFWAINQQIKVWESEGLLGRI